MPYPERMIWNHHERTIRAPRDTIARLLDTLAGPEDRLWPGRAWPPMRFREGLAVGASGGHGPVRYTVERIVPGSEIRFRFTGPAGFSGWHGFSVRDSGPGRCVLQHDLELRPSGWARLSWPLFFRPMHDALVEEALDLAEGTVTGAAVPPQRTVWVRVLRWATIRGARRHPVPGTGRPG